MRIDSHTHIFPRAFREQRHSLQKDSSFALLYGSPQAKLAGAGALLETMERERVDRAVVFGFPWRDPENYRRHNDYILEATHRNPSRLIGFACFSPLSPKGVAEAQRCLEAGMAGVGELAVYGRGLDEGVIDRLRPVMELCQEWDVPVLIHVNEPVGHLYPGKAPMTVSQIWGLVRAFPNNRIILAHWGGGLFFYALMKRGVKEALQKVWFDTAASPYLYEPSVYRIATELVGAEKILLGSDFPLLSPGRYLREIAASGLDAKARELVEGRNAARLLGLA